MSKHVTLAAFLVTVAIAAPAGWRALDADIQTDGKRVRPLQQSFTVDGTRITLDVDRGLVLTGDTVKATLVAYSDTRKQVAIDLTLFHSRNYEGERVDQPEVAIDHEKLVLEAAPAGGKPVSTALVLGNRPAEAARTDSFRVYITPHGTKVPILEGYNDGRPDVQAGLEAGKAAAVAILGWSGNSLDLQIKPEGPVTPDRPFTVMVRVTNTSGRRLPHQPAISLGTQMNPGGYIDTGEGVDIDLIDDRSEDHGLGRGKTLVEKFVVTPKHLTGKTVTFVAEANAWEDSPGPVIAGAIEAKTFALAETTPTVAAQ